MIISAYWIEEPAMITRITPNLTLAWVPAISGPRRPPDTRFWLALGIPSPSSWCAGGQGRATCTLSDCRFLCRAEWWDSGLVVSWVSRSVSDACVAVSALGQRRRWGRGLETAFAGTLLGEAPSSTEVDGMRPLIRIDRTEMYQWGLLDVLLASWGGAFACGSCAHALSDRRAGRRSVPWVSGSRDGPRRAGRRSQPRPARQAAAPPLRQRFGVDLA